MHKFAHNTTMAEMASLQKTVKLEELLLVIPFTVTEIVPVVALAGTVVVMLVDVIALTTAAVPLKLTTCTTEVGSGGLKLVPVMTTVVPTEPEIGLNAVIVGSGRVLLLEQEKNAAQNVTKTKNGTKFLIIIYQRF